MLLRLIRWILIIAALCGLGFFLLFVGYGLSRGYDVGAGLYHLFELAPSPVSSNPTLTNVFQQEVVWLADIANRDLDESSGLTASHRFDGILYSINDSGSEPVLYAMDLNGRHRGTWQIDVDEAVDWEAMDAVILNDEPHLLIADTGDNLRWRDAVTLLLVPEPHYLDTESGSLAVAGLVKVTYPTQAYDVEAVAIDATEGWIYLLSKRTFPHYLFRIPLAADGNVVAELVTTIDSLPQPDEMDYLAFEEEAKYRHLPTGMDIAPGGRLVVTTLKHAYLFDTRRLDASPLRIRLPTVGQREAITFAADSNDTLYFSRERYEGKGDADLYQLKLKQIYPSEP